MDVAIHLNQTYTTLRRLGYGGPRSLPFCFLLCLHFEGRLWCHTTAMSQWRQRQLRESWNDGNGGNANSRNFQRQRMSLSLVLSLVCGLFSVFKWRSTIFNSIHSSFPWRWWSNLAASQCCCVTVQLARCQSETVSWQAAIETAAGSCNWRTAALILWQ
jgi:hypothetical protein